MNYLIINKKTRNWHVSTLPTVGEDEMCIENYDVTGLDIANPQHYKVNVTLDGIEFDENAYTEGKANEVRAERDKRIMDVEWRVNRFIGQDILGLTPTDDIHLLSEYIQSLRDVPAQEGFPFEVIWPILSSAG